MNNLLAVNTLKCPITNLPGAFLLLTALLLWGSLTQTANAQEWKPQWFQFLRVIAPVDIDEIEEFVDSQASRTTRSRTFEIPQKGLLIKLSNDISSLIYPPAPVHLKQVMEEMKRQDPTMIVTYSPLHVPGSQSAARADAFVPSVEGDLFMITLACQSGVERWTVEIVASTEKNGKAVAQAFQENMRVDIKEAVEETIRAVHTKAPVAKPPVAKPTPSPASNPVPTRVSHDGWSVVFPDKPLNVAEDGIANYTYKVNPVNQPLTYWLDSSADIDAAKPTLEENLEVERAHQAKKGVTITHITSGTVNGVAFMEYEAPGEQTSRSRMFLKPPHRSVYLSVVRPPGTPWTAEAQRFFDSFQWTK